MNNTEKLISVFGEDAVDLKVNGRSAYGFNKTTGKVTYYSHSFPVMLVHQISRSDRFEQIDDNTLVFYKDTSYRLNTSKLKGSKKYTLTTTVIREGDEIRCTIHSGLVQMVLEAHLNDPQNESVKAKALSDLGGEATEGGLIQYMSSVFHTYLLDEDDFSWDGITGDFEVELKETGVADVRIVLTQEGEEIDLDPFRVTWFPEQSETGDQIGDAFFGDLETTLCNDYRLRDYEHIASSEVNMKAIVQMRDEDREYHNLTIQRDLTELIGHFEPYNYFLETPK